MAIPTRELEFGSPTGHVVSVPSTAVAAHEPVSMFERLARDESVSVEKLERLMSMHERGLELAAKSAFNAAFATMQEEIPVVIERAKTNNGTYAPLEDIQDAVRPILGRHGFGLSFRTEWPDAKTVKVIGILTHRDGHERTSEFLSSADSTGNKNAIQGLGSAVSYGRRYTTKDLLNITSRGADDDGGKPKKEAPAEPAGYSDWLLNLTAVADEGWDRLNATWQQSKREYTDHLTKTERNTLTNLKAKARLVGAK